MSREKFGNIDRQEYVVILLPTMVEYNRGTLAIRAQHDEVRRKALEAHRNSILTVAPVINERFGSMLSDDTPIEEIVKISRDSDTGIPIIKFTPIWDDVEMEVYQSDRIATIFASLALARPSGITTGEMRNLAETGEIRKMVGLSKISEVFLAVGFKKRETT